MFKYLHELIFVVVGALVIVVNIFLLSYTPLLTEMLNLVGGLVAVLPSVWLFYARFKKRKVIEEQFLVFVQDLTQAINSGMTLPLALRHVSKRNYFALSPAVEKVAAQVDWGIPFEKALHIFAKKSGSLQIKRAVDTINKTYRVGGKIGNTLNAIGESLLTIEKITKERSASVHSQIITSYLIYFVFIVILVILQVFLVPSLVPQQLPGLPGSTVTPLQEMFSQSFINFILVQGFFAGLVTGKMAEGSLAAGIKHSLLLIIIGYTIFTFAGQIEIRIL